MRTFILFAQKARTDGNFSLEDLPGSGRMDLVSRCVSATLFTSHAIRTDTRMFVVLNGPPNPPVTLTFDGSVLKKVAPDERGIAIWIKKALTQLADGKRAALSNGIIAERKSFQELLKGMNSPIYVLHEDGEPIEGVDVGKDTVWIIGDDVGLPDKDEKFALRFGKRVSLGKKSYLASACVSVVHWVCDRKE
jgi:tRNA (pseudouridine54-N1)-methyltransferase